MKKNTLESFLKNNELLTTNVAKISAAALPFSSPKRITKNQITILENLIEKTYSLIETGISQIEFDSIVGWNLISPTYKAELEKNRKELRSIVKTIILDERFKISKIYPALALKEKKWEIESDRIKFGIISPIYEKGYEVMDRKVIFETFKTVTEIYQSAKSHSIDNLEFLLGAKVSDKEVMDFAKKIRVKGEEAFNAVTNEIIDLEAFSAYPDIRLRKNFDSVKENIVDFFTGFHPKFGQIANDLLNSDRCHYTKTRDCLVLVSSYADPSKLVIYPSTKLIDEVGIVHEIAHGIHYQLKNSNNSIFSVDQTSLTLETVSALFEVLFIFREIGQASTKAKRKKIVGFFTKYLFEMFYSKAFNAEFESMFYIGVGGKIKDPKSIEKEYVKLWKSYFGNKFTMSKKEPDGWTRFSIIFDPHQNFAYLLSVIYGYQLFLKTISHRMTSEDIYKLLSSGDKFDVNNIIPVEKLIKDPDQYIEAMIQIISEYNRE